MATALQGFRLTARSCTCRAATRKFLQTPIGARRALSVTPSIWKAKQPQEPKLERQVEEPVDEATADAIFERLLEENVDKALAKLEASKAGVAARVLDKGDYIDQDAADLEDDVDENWESLVDDTIDDEYPPYQLPVSRKKIDKKTFLNEGEDEPWESEDMMLDDEDDITSIGHGELERHREMRHYARLIAWELPLLSKLAKPFIPPTREMPLRFRYTTYMGEQHPAEKKVTVEFMTADMPNLTDLQREKFKKLLGVRYNPTTDIVKMSCEMYESQAQNKRYLGNVVDSLLIEARDPTDTFEDIPLDTRHHLFKPRPRFPDAWAMTAARKAELEKYRVRQVKQAERKQLIDGVQMIAEGIERAAKVEAEDEVPVMAMNTRGGPRLGVRR